MNIVYGTEEELREMARAQARAEGRELIEIEGPKSVADLTALLRTLGTETQQPSECMCAPCKSVSASAKEVLGRLRIHAEQGDADAALSLAAHYSLGHGVPQKPKEAFKWLQFAAELGHPVALHNIGHMYYNGSGVKQDKQKAAAWWQIGADQGDALLQTTLAGMYFEGDGVPQDYVKAVSLSTKAAFQGNPWAMYNLGISYALGCGTSKNPVQAYAWQALAAARGIEVAVVSLKEIAGEMSRAQIKEGRKLSQTYAKKIRRQTSAAAKPFCPMV